MGSLPSHLRSNLYDLPVDVRTSWPIADLVGLAAKPPQTVPPPASKTLKPKTITRRARIWELNSHLHCSIIGTCMSAGELRRLLVRLKIGGIETADEHELHMLGVLLLADRPDQGAKLLQMALDRRHEVTINQFAKAKDDVAVAILWQKAIAGGDIPGGYWAVLTHPNSSDKLVQKAFGDIHMLSHLMGATNCADLQRMRQLEDENAALVAKLERQQAQLRDGFVERDKKIERLTNALAQKIQGESDRSLHADDGEAITLKATIADLNRRLARETGRRERLEQRQKDFEDAENGRRRAEAERKSRCGPNWASSKARSNRHCREFRQALRQGSIWPVRQSSTSAGAPAKFRNSGRWSSVAAASSCTTMAASSMRRRFCQVLSAARIWRSSRSIASVTTPWPPPSAPASRWANPSSRFGHQAWLVYCPRSRPATNSGPPRAFRR